MILILIAAKTFYRYPFTCPSMGLLGQGRRARSALEVLARVVLFLFFFFCVCVCVFVCVWVGAVRRGWGDPSRVYGARGL